MAGTIYLTTPVALSKDENTLLIKKQCGQRVRMPVETVKHAEIFKPILTDRIIFKVVRKNMLKESWFEKHGKVCLLTEVGRKNIVEQFALFCDQKEEGFSLRERMHKQAISLERHILGISKFKPYIRRV